MPTLTSPKSLSSSDLKLFAKIVQLAKLIPEKSLPLLNTKCMRNRRLLLLLSLLKVGSALNIIEALLKTEKYINLLCLLAYIPFEFLVFNGSPLLIYQVKENLRMAMQLKFLFIWKHRTLRPHKPLPPLVLAPNELDPFVLVLQRRQPILAREKRVELKEKAQIFDAWSQITRFRSAIARVNHQRLHGFFSKWNYAYQLYSTAVRVHCTNVLTSCFQTWKFATRASPYNAAQAQNILKFRAINLPIRPPLRVQPFNLVSIQLILFNEQISSALAFCEKFRAFNAIRSLYRSRKFALQQQQHLIKSSLIKLCSFLNYQRGLSKTSVLYRESRIWQHFFDVWLAKTFHTYKYEKSVENQIKFRVKEDVFDGWKALGRKKKVRRKCFETWKTFSAYRRKVQAIGEMFQTKVQSLYYFRLWLRAKMVLDKKSNSNSLHFKTIQSRKLTGFLAKWKSKTEYARHQDLLVIKWRDYQQSIFYLRLWQRFTKLNLSASEFEATALKLRYFGGLKKIFLAKQEIRECKTQIWNSWRRVFGMRQGFRMFIIKMVAGSKEDQFTPLDVVENISEPDQVVLVLLKLRAFRYWKIRTQMVDKANAFQKSHLLCFLNDTFKAWRCGVQYNRIVKNEARLGLSRQWSKFKTACQIMRQQQIVLELRHEEYDASRDFINYYRCFKTWERAFQIRKMEEHLCEQNLMSYRIKEKRLIWRTLKLATLERYWEKYCDTVYRNKWLARWRSASRRIQRERKRRMYQRTMSIWKSSLLHRDMSKRLLILEKQKRIFIFIRWKRLVGQRNKEYNDRVYDIIQSKKRHVFGIWKNLMQRRKNRSTLTHTNQIKRITKLRPNLVPPYERLLPIPVQSLGPTGTPGSPRKGVKSVVFEEPSMMGGSLGLDKSSPIKLCPPPTIAPRRIVPKLPFIGKAL